MFRGLWRVFIHIKTRQRVAPVPRRLANPFDGDRVDDDLAGVFARTAVRDPDDAARLMRELGAADMRELRYMLAFHKPGRNLYQRFILWYMRVTGATPYEPVVGPHLRRRRQRRDVL